MWPTQGVIAAETIAGATTLGMTDYTMMPLRVVATSRWPNSPSAPTEKPDWSTTSTPTQHRLKRCRNVSRLGRKDDQLSRLLAVDPHS